MKRILTFTLALLMLLSLTACGQTPIETEPSTAAPTETTEPVEDPTDDATAAPDDPTDTTAEPSVDQTTEAPTEPGKKGCKSTIGLTALLTVVGAVLTLRKKREE